MASFKKYFSYQFKKSLPKLAIMGIVSLLFTVLFVNAYIYTNENARFTGFDGNYTKLSIAILPFILGTLCTIVPILELSPFKNRRNLDTLLFLPVSRLKMSIAHYLNGLIQVLSIYTACSIYTILYLLQYRSHLALKYFLPYFALTLLYGIILYSLFMFIFYQGNTTADGVIFQIIYMFVLWIVLESVIYTLDFQNTYLADNYVIYAPISKLTYVYSDMIEQSYLVTSKLEPRHYIMLIIWAALGIASIFGYIYSFVKKKTEAVGGISNSYFGYRILIPACGYSLLLLMGGILSWILVATMYIGYIIYRRSIKLKKADYICLAVSVVPIFISLIIH